MRDRLRTGRYARSPDVEGRRFAWREGCEGRLRFVVDLNAAATVTLTLTLTRRLSSSSLRKMNPLAVSGRRRVMTIPPTLQTRWFGTLYNRGIRLALDSKIRRGRLRSLVKASGSLLRPEHFVAMRHQL